MRTVEKLITDLKDRKLREKALSELSRKQKDFAPLLWNCFRTRGILLQEILLAYKLLSPPNMSLAQSHRVCNALALFQCLASHPVTRRPFLEADLPVNLSKFLETTCPSREFAWLRVSSLGVIGHLVKDSDPRSIYYLLSSQIMPGVLKAMDNGTKTSKVVGAFIVHKILLDDAGLQYVCTLAGRVFAVNLALGNVLSALVVNPSSKVPRLFRIVMYCYLQFTRDRRSLWALSHLPQRLTSISFRHYFEDPATYGLLTQLLGNIQRPHLIAPEGYPDQSMIPLYQQLLRFRQL